MFGRLRGRLDAIQADAQRTMQQAQDSMEKASISVTTLTKVLVALLEEVGDGFSITITLPSGPVKMQIALKEGDEDTN